MDRTKGQTVFHRALCACGAGLGALAALRIRFLHHRIGLILRAAERADR